MTHNSCASRRTSLTSQIQLLDFPIPLVRHDASYVASWRTRSDCCFCLVILLIFNRFRKTINHELFMITSRFFWSSHDQILVRFLMVLTYEFTWLCPKILHEIPNNSYSKSIRRSNRDDRSDTTVAYRRHYRASRSGLRGPVRPDPEDHVNESKVRILNVTTNI